jgi:hypothetical protein
VSSQCFGERPDGGQTDDVTYGHAPAGGVTPLFLLESHEDIVRERSPDATFCTFWVPGGGPVAFLTHSVANSPNATKARLASRTVADGSVVAMVGVDGGNHVLRLGGPKTRECDML